MIMINWPQILMIVLQKPFRKGAPVYLIYFDTEARWLLVLIVMLITTKGRKFTLVVASLPQVNNTSIVGWRSSE